jgi:hypothetical protein
MISDIGNSNSNSNSNSNFININEESPKMNLYVINDSHEKSKLIAKDENSNENLKEITMLMKQILEE